MRRAIFAEWAPALGLALVATLGYLAAGRLLDPRLADPRAANVWFDSDLPYRLETMQHPGGWHNGGAHPLFPSLGSFQLRAGSLAGGSDAMQAASRGGALLGGAFVVLLFALFRRLGLERLDATLLAAIGAASSAALFWFPVPESFGLAGCGVALALLVAAASAASAAALVAASVASGAAVITNGLVGLLAVLSHHPRPRLWGRALGILLSALGATTALWAVQEWSFATPFFLGDRLFEYRQHTFPPSLERTAHVAAGLVVHSVVAPALRNDRPSFRNVAPFTSGPLGGLATLAWLALLAAGCISTWRLARQGQGRPLAICAAGSLLLTGALHLTLGREMFLYALDVLPLLLVLAAGAARVARGRRVVRGLAVMLLLAGLANNVTQLRRASEAARDVVGRRVTAPVSAPGQ